MNVKERDIKLAPIDKTFVYEGKTYKLEFKDFYSRVKWNTHFVIMIIVVILFLIGINFFTSLESLLLIGVLFISCILVIELIVRKRVRSRMLEVGKEIKIEIS